MLLNPVGHRLKWPIFLGIYVCLGWVQAREDWSYVESANGSSKWAEKYPFCAGQAQSPVKLPGDNPRYKTTLLPVHIFADTQQVHSRLMFNITLEDHYLKLIVPHETYYMSLMNDNRKQYEIYEINFHWGSDDKRGSEHWLFGKQYAMETQVFGYNKLLYPTKERALLGPNGVAALSFIHEACNDVTKEETLIGMMTGLYETVNNFHNSTHRKSLDGFDLTKMLGSLDRGKYFRYHGSLTTPPCTENVVWTVFQETVPVLPQQLEVFRKLRDMVNDEEYRMANNYRPTLPVNNDESYIPRKIFSTVNGAPSVQYPGATLISLIIGCVLRAIY